MHVFDTRRMLRASATLTLLASFTAIAPRTADAQTAAKKVLTVDDYSRWRSINNSAISSDGKWVTYVLSLTNTLPADAKPVLHLLKLETNEDLEVPNATGPAFSADGRWIAYSIEPPGAGRGGRGGRGGGGAPPAGGAAPAGQGRAGQGTPPAPPRRVELRNLATGAVQSWQDIQSFTFSATSSHLILRRRAPGAAGGAGGRGAPGGGEGGGAGPAPQTPTNAARGADVILHDLVTNRDQLLGAVGEISFNKKGDLLAYTVDATPRDGNGLFVLDLRNGGARITALDNDARVYARLTWNDAGTALAVLKGVDVEKMRERDNMLLVYRDVQAALTDVEHPATKLDPAKATGFPKGFVVSERGTLDWSDDNGRVFFGMKEQVAAPDTARRRGTDEVADVDIWNTKDERIQSVQMIRADADRNFTYREAFDVAGSKFVKLADSTMREVDVGQDGRWAVGRDTRGYISDYKRPAADLYRVNTSTGERTLIAKNQLIGQHVLGISPDGNNFVFW
jgi:hypothetical protein